MRPAGTGVRKEATGAFSGGIDKIMAVTRLQHRARGCNSRAEKGDRVMQPEARTGRMAAVQARPLAELLECPTGTSNLLNCAANCISVDVGEVLFRQSAICRGIYVIVSGQFLRRTERLETRLNLGVARPGDLVELAAALGDCRHTYTLSAQTAASVLLLPMQALNQAFEAYPPMRMHLLEELAREVSRGYEASCLNRMPRTRRHGPLPQAL